MPFLIKCQQCNKEFKVADIHLKQGRKYCSRKCYIDATGKIVSCLTCKKEIRHWASRIKKGQGKYCSRKCAYQGLPKSFRQTTLSITQKKKISDTLKKGYSTGKIVHWNLGKTFLQKENHPNWKGGITPVSSSVRNSIQYKDWRKSIFERDNYTCQLCNLYGGKLAVDHYPITFAEILHKNNISSIEDAILCDAFWDISNGRTLCLECHKKTPTYLKPYLFSSPNPNQVKCLLT